MLNLILETGRSYFFRVIVSSVILFLLSTFVSVSRANPKIIKLTPEELASLNHAKKCNHIGLELNTDQNFVTLDGIGIFSLHNIYEGTPNQLVFGIVNSKNEGKKYEIPLKQIDSKSWTVSTTIYGLQATQELKFEISEKDKTLSIKMFSDSITFKNKTYKEINFTCLL